MFVCLSQWLSPVCFLCITSFISKCCGCSLFRLFISLHLVVLAMSGAAQSSPNDCRLCQSLLASFPNLFFHIIFFSSLFRPFSVLIFSTLISNLPFSILSPFLYRPFPFPLPFLFPIPLHPFSLLFHPPISDLPFSSHSYSFLSYPSFLHHPLSLPFPFHPFPIPSFPALPFPLSYHFLYLEILFLFFPLLPFLIPLPIPYLSSPFLSYSFLS